MQVLEALPAARLAGAMLGGRGDLEDSLLVERLEWLQNWLITASQTDAEQQVGKSRLLSSLLNCCSLKAQQQQRALT